MKPLPPQARLRELLDYDPETGVLTWKQSRGRGVAGRPAGSPTRDGYLRLCVDGQMYAAHRVVYKWQTGRDPKGMLDHANGDRQDNRWVNIREATAAQNSCNRGLRSDNTSGVTGVFWHAAVKKWVVSLKAPGGPVVRATFTDYEEACKMADTLRPRLHGEFTRSRK